MAVLVLIGMLLAVLIPFLLLVLSEPLQSIRSIVGVVVTFMGVVTALVALCHWESTYAR